MKLPPILDATCGARMMWFDKKNPLALFVDRRTLPETELCDGRKFEISPDMEVDFTAMPFRDNSFSLVVFDPPHLIRAGDDAYMTIKYGRLPKDWREVLAAGFRECMRVLRPHGTLIFKWNEYQIPTRDVIAAIGATPLFGHPSGRASKTHWMTFMKTQG
jgi:SAM-dependent methyltransferase